MPDAVGSKRIEEHGFARAHRKRQQNRTIHQKRRSIRTQRPQFQCRQSRARSVLPTTQLPARWLRSNQSVARRNQADKSAATTRTRSRPSRLTIQPLTSGSRSHPLLAQHPQLIVQRFRELRLRNDMRVRHHKHLTQKTRNQWHRIGGKQALRRVPAEQMLGCRVIQRQ